MSGQATLPSKNNTADAGWDLYASESLLIPKGERASIHTNIAIQIPNGFVGLIWPRSGLAVKQGVDVLAGVIDSGYRGELLICLLNTGDRHVEIHKGDRIAQLLIQPIHSVTLKEVEMLSSSPREDKGFGSSGK